MDDYDLSIISTVDLINGASIALTACPGRRGNYQESLDRIRAWNPTVILSLIEDSEFPFSMTEFRNDLSNMGISWIRFPIENYNIPTNKHEWTLTSGKIHNIINNSGRVIIRCWGGLGRSGMVAARLLTERGKTADWPAAGFSDTELS
ncbi:hypothetical protein [Ciceribacter sp. RN22]|uniref:phosphatase domain-containing putative toxin n=1 Tax=Ciceribacter sp. RN22 TaxID=2954932 RepID=UPI00209237E7|nr:hypothetical protein [Ciceribacter sp. RN22]MCO6180628.1 hypothetical protein [Ciceribacter sp. RN22]